MLGYSPTYPRTLKGPPRYLLLYDTKILVNHHQLGNLHELMILKYQLSLASRGNLGQAGRRDSCG